MTTVRVLSFGTEDRMVPSDLGQELTVGFAGRYIGFKARQLSGCYGYVATDLPDLEQELVLRLWRRLPRFDPGRATWNAFVVTVVDRQVATILVARLAQKRQDVIRRLLPLTRAADDEEATDRAQNAVPIADFRRDLEEFELAHDIDIVVRRLPPKLRLVWEWLQTDNVRQTAQGLRVAPMTVYHRLRKLRRIFEAAELASSRPRAPESLDKRRAIPVGT